MNSSRWQVTSRGGRYPLWAHSGRELFCLSPTGDMMALPVTTGAGFAFGNPVRLFGGVVLPPGVSTFRRGERHYDLAADDQRFLMIKESGTAQAEADAIIVVLNWFEELKALVPTR